MNKATNDIEHHCSLRYHTGYRRDGSWPGREVKRTRDVKIEGWEEKREDHARNN